MPVAAKPPVLSVPQMNWATGRSSQRTEQVLLLRTGPPIEGWLTAVDVGSLIGVVADDWRVGGVNDGIGLVDEGVGLVVEGWVIGSVTAGRTVTRVPTGACPGLSVMPLAA